MKVLIILTTSLALAEPGFARVNLSQSAGKVCPGQMISMAVDITNELNTAALFTVDVRFSLPGRSIRVNEVVNIGTDESYSYLVAAKLHTVDPGTYPFTMTVSTDIARETEVVDGTLDVVACTDESPVSERPAASDGNSGAISASLVGLVVLLLLGVVVRVRRNGSRTAQPPVYQGYYNQPVYRRPY
ncbi:MAG: hypothetical protein QGG50_05250 [Methanopyri archaeon]|jgi:hypothetical protein|nr:hypothetical protein [Methanopyri archaeon]